MNDIYTFWSTIVENIIKLYVSCVSQVGLVISRFIL